MKDIIKKPASKEGAKHRQVNKYAELRDNKQLSDWSVAELCDWLSEQGMAEYATSLRLANWGSFTNNHDKYYF